MNADGRNRTMLLRKLLLAKRALLILFLALLGSSAWLSTLPSPYWSSIGSNLVAGFIGSIATIFGIDYLIRRSEQRARLPLRAACYEDVRFLTARALSIWGETYAASDEDAKPADWSELLSESAVELTLDGIDPFNSALVVPPVPWWQWFDQEIRLVAGQANKVMTRYAAAQVDPQVFRAVRDIEYYVGPPMGALVSAGVLQPGKSVGPLPDRLWFDALLFLYEWTVNEYEVLTNEVGMAELLAPYKFASVRRKSTH